jgi:hypothetical protein
MDPDTTLAKMRTATQKWETAEFGSRQEAEAAEEATSAAAALDYHLVHGGQLPADWNRARFTMPFGKYAEQGRRAAELMRAAAAKLTGGHWVEGSYVIDLRAATKDLNDADRAHEQSKYADLDKEAGG